MKDREARKSLETDLEDATKSLDEMNRNALILSGELEKANSRISNLEDEKEVLYKSLTKQKNASKEAQENMEDAHSIVLMLGKEREILEKKAKKFEEELAFAKGEILKLRSQINSSKTPGKEQKSQKSEAEDKISVTAKRTGRRREPTPSEGFHPFHLYGDFSPYQLVWDPWLIVAQIVCLQCLYYLTLGSFLSILVGTRVSRLSLVYFFDFVAVTTSTITGWCVIASFLFSSIAGAGYMLYLIERAKKCLDFSATLYVIHLFICIIYGGWPSSMTWWIVNGTGLAVMALLGEYLCIRRELREIPIARYRSIGIRVCGLRSVSKLSCFSQLGNDMEWPQKMEMVCQLWGDRACDTRKPSVYNCGWFLGKMLVVVLILFSGSVPYFNMNLDEFP
ncbi:hypothetical protein GH714_022815 [Hevea brasiliensis]|uniref:Protein SYS1 homolog n=1 Tax=Hevea brasiliensis TaxID=3981 RepID=A0A6A6LIU2_HEVBR|nr:hypothetical protein GH714_022815 [Hevea brasiliensis]